MLLIEDNFGELFAVSLFPNPRAVRIYRDSGKATKLTGRRFAAHFYCPSPIREIDPPSA